MSDMPQQALPVEAECLNKDMLSQTEEIFRRPGLGLPKLNEEVIEALHAVDKLISKHEASRSAQKNSIPLLEKRIAECDAMLNALKTEDTTDVVTMRWVLTSRVEQSRRTLARNEKALEELRAAKEKMLPLMGIGIGGFLTPGGFSLR